MKRFTTLFAIILTFALMGCNDHNPNGDCVDCGDDNTNNVTQSGTVDVETLSPKKTALWAELSDGNYDFGLARDRTSSDPDLIGNQVHLPEGLAAMVVTGEDQIIVTADDLFEVVEVTDVSRFEQLIRNVYDDDGNYLPTGWQPNLFPTNEGQTVDLEILLAAFIRARMLDLFSHGFEDGFSFSDFRYVAETSYYEWNGQNKAKYIFIIKR